MKEYIEREAVVNLREEFWKDRCDYMAVRVTNIMNIPAAKVKPIETAYWDWQVDGTHFCSECGHDALYYSHPTTYKKTEYYSKYCPNCGKVMTHVETPNDTGIGEYECDE